MAENANRKKTITILSIIFITKQFICLIIFIDKKTTVKFNKYGHSWDIDKVRTLNTGK